MLTEKYDFRITDQMTIPLRPHWIANDSYREKCKMLVLNRSKGEIHKVDFSKHEGLCLRRYPVMSVRYVW